MDNKQPLEIPARSVTAAFRSGVMLVCALRVGTALKKGSLPMGGLTHNFAPLSHLSDQALVSGLLPASLMLMLGFEESSSLAMVQRRTAWNRRHTVFSRTYKNDAGGRLIISRDRFE